MVEEIINIIVVSEGLVIVMWTGVGGIVFRGILGF